MTIKQAFGKIEGYGADVANRPTRNHNPGDIEWGAFARAHGATRPEIQRDGTIGRFAYFPNAVLGWKALDSLLRVGFYRTATVAEAVNHYAPPCENDTRNYVALVCRWVGCSPQAKLTDLLLMDNPAERP